MVMTGLVVGAGVVGIPPSPPLRPAIKRKRIINQLETSRNTEEIETQGWSELDTTD